MLTAAHNAGVGVPRRMRDARGVHAQWHARAVRAMHMCGVQDAGRWLNADRTGHTTTIAGCAGRTRTNARRRTTRTGTRCRRAAIPCDA